MASYPNGQPYRTLYTNPTGPSAQSSRYGGHVPPRSHPLNIGRTSSFNNGDDGPSNFEGQEERRLGTRSQRVTSNAGMQEGELFIGTDSSQLNTFHSGGYQHRNSPPLPPLPPSRPSYNPQEYAQSPVQQSPQVYSNPNPIQPTGYQPYVPAAYQATNVVQQPSYSGQSFSPTYSSPTLQYLPGQSPPIPPRHEQSAGHRRLSQLGASLNHPYSYSASNSPQRQHAYTPPAPPPPPFSPVRDAFPSGTPPPLPSRTPYNNTAPLSPTFAPGARQSSLNRLPSLPNDQGNTNHASACSSQPSPALSSPSLPGPTPPQHSPQRTNTIGRHPQARPLPGPPPETPDSNLDTDYFGNGASYDYNSSIPGVDDMMREIEEAVMGRPASLGIHGQSPRSERIYHQARIDEEEEPMPLFSSHSSTGQSPDTRNIHMNGTGVTSGSIDAIYNAYSDESDAEAAAGLAAMRLAEEQDAAEESRRSSSNTATSRAQGSQYSQRQDYYQGQEQSSDSDVPMDIESYGGGLPNHYGYNYGNRSTQPISNLNSQTNLSDLGNSNNYYMPTETLQRSGNSEEALTMPPGNYFMSDDEAIHPFPTFGARVDTGGTGGLQEPGSHPRRLSFEDGDEATLVDYSDFARPTSSASSMTYRDSISTYPTPSSSRPLPRVPASGSEYGPRRRQTDQFGRPLYPLAPDEYAQYSAGGVAVQKANSIGSHSTTPHVLPPGRSVTDAEQRRRHQVLSGLRTDTNADIDASMASSGKFGGLDLPAIPPGRRKKFIPEKLSTQDYKRCLEPWALSAILAWIKEMTEGEADLREHAIIDGIVQLFTHKVPTMNTADAEGLSAKVVADMFSAGALVKEEEWVKFGTESMSGVLFQVTGAGCYSSRVHDTTITGRCYSHHCMRTLKKIELHTQGLDQQDIETNWNAFYKLKPEDIAGASEKEIKRQRLLHEICSTEEEFTEHMKFWKFLYGNALADTPRDYIIPRKRMKSFMEVVFSKADAVKQVNEDYVLAQLRYRQEKEGPWISGVSNIFREWVRKAKQPYVDYAANFPKANRTFRREIDTNPLFRQFIEKIEKNERFKRLHWDTFIKAPITRIQRYILLLSTTLGVMVEDSEEKHNLQLAVDEIKAVTVDCDNRVAEMNRIEEIEELEDKLVLRPEMDNVKLNLKHLGRQLIHEGDLQRKARMSWVDTHAILFDHYLVLSKMDQQRDAVGNKRDIYDVSKLPIPMDLLVLESTNDDPVIRSTVRGVTAIPNGPSKTQLPQEARFGRTISNQSTGTGPGALTHTNTSSSVNSNGTGSSNRAVASTTILDPSNEKILYPFRVKHLGKSDQYTLYAPTAQSRVDWCEKITDAKTRHAASLFAQNAEPFKLRVMADTAFHYDAISGGPRSTVIRGTPLDRAIRAVEDEHGGTRLNPVCRAQVNCATAFNHPYGKKMVAVGTDYGVYLSEYDNPRGWTKAIQATKVTQVGVLEEFSLFLVISDRSLVAYHLDTVCPAGGVANAGLESSNRRAPQKLSGSRDVGFFATGRMKDRTLVFYKKKDNTHSTFKVIEPVYQKSSVSTRNRFGIKKGTTDIFRDFDEFYIPVETYAINLFSSSLAVATARGVEVLTLDKKVPFSIPDLKAPECASIAARIRDQKPLGMFRLSDSEFLLVFEEVGIYVDRHGDVSRAVVMEFVGKAKQAVLYRAKYLVLVDVGSGFVEVRNAIDGRLKQVVSGRDVRLLDDGANGGMVKICMQHPELERCQVVLEMIVNEGLKE